MTPVNKNNLISSTMSIVVILALTTLPLSILMFDVEAAPAEPKFNEDKAFSHLKNQMAFGPRIPGTQAHHDCLDYLAQTLRSTGLEVQYQNFTGAKGDGEGVAFNNLIGVIKANTTTDKDVIVAAHYDTRPFSDHDITKAPIEPDYSNPVPGANDGASGVGILLELARVLKGMNLTYNIKFFFTDGEDYGEDIGSMFYGAKYYAGQMTSTEIENTKYLILLDMIGDMDLTVHREGNSDPKIMERIWAKAAELGHDQFKNSDKYDILDDHIPFKDKGVRVVDIIDFDYPNTKMNYWHTPDDTLDKVSAESLGAVGGTIEAFLIDEIVSNPDNGNMNNNTPPPPPPPKKTMKDQPFIPFLSAPQLLIVVVLTICVKVLQLNRQQQAS